MTVKSDGAHRDERMNGCVENFPHKILTIILMFDVNTDVSANSSTLSDIIISFYFLSIEYECAENGDRNEVAKKRIILPFL